MTESTSTPGVTISFGGVANFPSPRVSRIMEARRVAEQIAALPHAIYDEHLSTLAQQACVDAFFAYVRTLIEFLEVRPSNDRRDLVASALAPGWQPQLPPDQQARLIDHWQTASEHVMHFSRSRTKQDDGSWVATVGVSREALQAIADDVLSVWDQYALKLGHPLSPARSGFGLFSNPENVNR